MYGIGTLYPESILIFLFIWHLVQNNSTLEVLSLEGNGIENEGETLIKTLASSNRSLISLDLACNSIPSDGINS